MKSGHIVLDVLVGSLCILKVGIQDIHVPTVGHGVIEYFLKLWEQVSVGESTSAIHVSEFDSCNCWCLSGMAASSTWCVWCVVWPIIFVLFAKGSCHQC